MLRRPPRSTRTDTLFPYTTLFRSWPLITARLRVRVLPGPPFPSSFPVQIETDDGPLRRQKERDMGKRRTILVGGLAVIAIVAGTVAVRTATFAPKDIADGSGGALAAVAVYVLAAAGGHLSAP